MKKVFSTIIVFGIVCLFGIEWGVGFADAAPPMPMQMRGDGTANIVTCVDFRCQDPEGPVCGIDSSGELRTFENRCIAELTYCREGRYYVVMKPGEC